MAADIAPEPTPELAERLLRLDRRAFVAGLATTALGRATPATAAAEARPELTLRAQADTLSLGLGQQDTPILSLGRPTPPGGLRFQRGDVLEMQLSNATTAPIALDWHGLDGVPAIEPLTASAPLAPQTSQSVLVPLRHAGTLLCDFRLLGDGQAPPSAARAVIVAEGESIAVDRDEVLLFEDWRLRPDGTAINPGTDPKGTMPVCTVNGLRTLDIPTRVSRASQVSLDKLLSTKCYCCKNRKYGCSGHGA